MGEKQLGNELGLSTKEALNRLEQDIEKVLNQFRQSQLSRKSKSWFLDVLHPCSQHSIVNWISILVISIIILLFVISSFTYGDFWFFLQASCILILLPLNLLIILHDSKLRHSELTRRVVALLDIIRKEKERIFWKSSNYPHLLSPFSPCITLQWTYRDNKLVNLPWALLVRDDVVVIRPGQISPGYCESLEKGSEYALLHAKEVYGPSLQNANECFSNPKSRKPLENKKYKVLETPYLNNLRIALEQSLDRPVTIQEQQRHFVTIKMMEWFFLPIVLGLTLIVNGARFKYLEYTFADFDWFEVFVLNSVCVILPLLQLVFPMVWMCLNYLGMARFICICNVSMQSGGLTDTESYDIEDSTSVENSIIHYNIRDVWDNFLSILQGKETMMTRSTKIVHVLGSLTALCCIDKKGILSWPNPTAEKIFFLRNVEDVSQNSSLANVGELSTDADSTRGISESIPNKSEGNLTNVAEVLDLTHNPSDPFKLQFDDTDWKKYLNSLKPLGLSILLNTCNLSTQEDYTKFCSHITCEAMYNENLVPVTNRRCLCELAKEIGFVNEAKEMFALEQQLSTFRHLQTEMARRDKYVRSLQMATKLKFPFPHMFSVVVKEKNSNALQLLSQGTADIVLDSCIDYWDGYDLCPLSYSERKKIQDFYQRSSLTAYCTAFAYRPLYKGINEKLSRMYLELPSDSRHLYVNHRSPTPIHSDCRSVLEPHIKGHLSHFYSTDSLLHNDSPVSDISDVESCFEMQCNQVFIGMVTMQYQAQMDMVHLIEQLEGACIRFVHFSKENELRSRVFSEKMGLESGWNCHISLLSERSRRESGPSECWANNGTARVSSPADLPHRVSKLNSTALEAQPNSIKNSTLDSSKGLSYSAPSAINLDHVVVKFDTEQALLSNETTDHLDIAGSRESINLQTEINGTSHDWQSLSCLTDSTEQSVPINFDMSNRAKLPRGIDKIRPHIEHIDNVPLLVSLFTDCTASSTKEMIRIMQDYGEVICVIGSSANYETMGVFMQADASVAIEPLHPQMCQKSETYKSVTSDCLSPIDLSRALNSVSCCLSFKREDPLSIFQLIIESRHYMSLVWNTVRFWLCSSISLTLLQMLAVFFMLPFILTTGQVLWLCCIIIPILSVSMMGTAIDVDEIKKPQGKKQIGLNFEIFVFVLWCYAGKFLPMILSVFLTFAGMVTSHCMDTCEAFQNCTCTFYYLPTSNSGNPMNSGHFSENVTLAQNLCVILILLHLVTISVNFVHREYTICRKSPHKNFLWICCVTAVCLFQLVFSLINFKIGDKDYETDDFQVQNFVYIFAFLTPLATFASNEFIKREEIKTNLRYQRRARLDFETKLGMNSPF